MRVGISIDGVLRDLFNQIEETHKKYFPTEEGEEQIEIKDYDFEKWITFPKEEVTQGEMEFNPNFSEDEFLESEQNTELSETVKQTTIDEFLYEKCTVEIFGYADEMVKSAVETINQLILENPQHEFYIISREGGLAIPSTLFFLSKTKSICSNIKFVTEHSKVWDYVDVMITDHPKVANSVPKGKLVLLIDKEFNQNIKQSGTRVGSVKEIDVMVLDTFSEAIENGDSNSEWIL